MTTNDGTVGRYLGWFLVALSLGAGVIHFAHAGEHFDLTWYHGTFFAVVAWLQLSWAAAVIVRPTRRLLLLGVLGNLAVVVTWAVSRTAGMPFGPTEGDAESVALSDGLATGFEVGIVLVCLAVLLRPAMAQQSVRPALGFGGLGIGGVAVAVVSTLALTPSFAAEHSHGEEAGADHHAAGAETAAHGHEGTEGAEGHEGVMIMADGTSECEKSGITSEGNAGGSGHGHRGPVEHTPLTAAERATYRDQVAKAQVPVQKYPTVADAEAAGWRRITAYVPCIAAHYIKSGALMNGFDPTEPEILLYAGTDPDSELVGLSYLALSETEPEGFAGKLDSWHVHESLCIGGAGVVGDTGTTDEQCAERGGRNIPLGNLWMNHMWNVSGWDSRWGLFSSEHPDLGGTFGNING